jgi:DNA-binding winged helix-turn-helix (wHTH) protein/tetratricopeptide (TPR) repeat protein
MSLDLKSNLDEFNLSLVKPSLCTIYGFESFRLDAEHLMLYRDGGEISLTPKQVGTLLVLVEHGGEIVSKDVLMTRLWGDTAVEESNLIQNIHFLRKVLGETSDGRPMIETLRRRGYRFNAKVTNHRHRSTEVSAGLRLADLEDGPKPPMSNMSPNASQVFALDKISNRRAMAAIIMAAIFIALVIMVFFVGRPMSKSTASKKIAILPLTPIDPANRNVLYEMGIADSLIKRLNPAKGLIVLSLSAVRTYTDAELNPVAAGHELQVDYVVDSTYQISNGQIKVTSQIVDVSTGKVESTFTSAADAASLFSAQDAITNDIGNRLVTSFGSYSAASLISRGTNSEKAYGFYLTAMNLSEERGTQNLLKSLEYLDRAVALDPDYAAAWAAEALTHSDIVGHTDAGQREHYQKSMEAISRALEIDPNLSEAYSALCRNRFRYEFDFVAAESACKHALELGPNSPTAHKIYGNLLYGGGRFDESIAEINKAIDLQPVSFRNQQMYGLALYYARRYAEAEAQFKRLVELNSNQSFTHGYLVDILEAEGKEDEAFDHLITKMVIDNAENEKIEQFKSVYHISGWNGVVLKRINEVEAEAKTNPKNFQLACLNARIGNTDRALDYLEKAFQQRSFMIAVIEVHPQLDPLRNEPRYIDLVSRIKALANKNRTNL